MNPKNDQNTENAIICHICGQTLFSFEYMGNDDQYYCEDCFAKNFFVCNNCGTTYPIYDMNETGEGGYYCSDCYDKFFAECSSCNETYRTTEMYSYEGDYYCSDCYDDLFGRCGGCGGIYPLDELYYSERDDNQYCECCYGETDCLPDHDYQPNLIYYRGRNEAGNEHHRINLYYGIELEVEAEGNDIESVVDGLPEFVFAKCDGSLNNGFEIVSHPCTYQWLKENPDKWNKILNLRKQGYRSFDTDTCGLHIHLSKNYFGTWHLYKFLKLFYENPEFILRISQRDKHSLQHWATLQQVHFVDHDDESLIYKAKYKRGNYHRYTAINLQNTHTIEIRIFKGTLNPRSFWKNIEFLKAVVDFTLDAALKDITVLKFLRFVHDHKQDYINLFNWLHVKDFYKDSLIE